MKIADNSFLNRPNFSQLFLYFSMVMSTSYGLSAMALGRVLWPSAQGRNFGGLVFKVKILKCHPDVNFKANYFSMEVSPTGFILHKL